MSKVQPMSAVWSGPFRKSAQCQGQEKKKKKKRKAKPASEVDADAGPVSVLQ